ncbi:MAG: zinc-ribbon domain-containing protein, partial [Nocardioidaceae bacterium]
MPFCTECGHRNPEGARFCSQCGHRLVVPDRPAESTSTLNFGGPDRSDTDSDGALSPADEAALDALPAGSALLVVLRGPSAGSRFLLDTEE